MSGVFINLGKKEREMKFTFLSFKALEQHYKKPAQKVFEEEMASGHLSDIAVIIWACLRKEKLTVAKVEELIDDAIEDEDVTFEELSDKLSKAIGESKMMKGSQPKEEGTENPN